jgi:hypothetical protein
MKILVLPFIAALCAAAYAQETPPDPSPAAASSLQSERQATLPAGTTVLVSLNDELATISNQIGDRFGVTVVQDVTQDGVVVIPKGTQGRGQITFLTKKGSFGKPGILGIALQHLDLNGEKFLLDGRYREEGGNNNAAAAATMFAVGIGAILVKGKSSAIPQGRELKARTGEDINFSLSPQPSAAPTAVEAKDVVPSASPGTP